MRCKDGAEARLVSPYSLPFRNPSGTLGSVINCGHQGGVERAWYYSTTLLSACDRGHVRRPQCFCGSISCISRKAGTRR